MIKLGIIGLGNIGLAHAKTIFSGQVEGMTLAGICDIDPAKQELSNTLFPGVSFFHSHEDLLAADIEAVIISVPHPLHAKLSIAALNSLTFTPSTLLPTILKYPPATRKNVDEFSTSRTCTSSNL